jgi:diguanylate cyclase (GGDEF)-like protein
MATSLNRVAGLTAGLVLLAVLSAGGGVLLLIQELQAHAQQQRGAASARLAAARVAALIAPHQESARRLAAQAAELGLLNDKKAVDRAQFLTQFAPTLPQVLKLRLLAAGTRDTDPNVPELSYACLDLLDRSARGEPVPGAELHLAGTPSAHIDVFAPIRDPADNQLLLGHVLLSLDPAAAQTTLAAVTAEDGYAELQQAAPPGEALVLASGGNVALKSGAPLHRQAITGTGWQLAFWPAPSAWSPAPTPYALLAGAVLVTLVLLGLALTLPRRWLARVLRQDSETLSTLFNDVRSGVLMDQYPFRLRELAGLAQQLRQSGEAMIADRRTLESRTQRDALTGLASHTAFDERLAQLHRQARGGFSSALMIADIDNLEAINAEIGPDAGDILIKQFARQLREVLRQSDIVARLDGGRFAVLFPFTDLEKIEPVVQRLRTRLAQDFNPGSGVPRAYSWSAGLTLLAAADGAPQEIITRAEHGLAAARRDGGNRTITHMPSA